MTDCCSNGKVLVYPCSGGSNTGEIADRVARLMQKKRNGKMSCLASLGAHIDGFMVSARDADLNITIDGCQVACARKIFEHLGIPVKSYTLTEMEIVKGKTPVEQTIIEQLCEKIITELPKYSLAENQNTCCCG
ncbi:MAG TPA: hypothetical protein DHW42_11920 [Candidatus Marinimicrobia bacterium]|nr:hypothetical protein [Candidatus Neomarinimicrobiota bacterium]